MRHRKLLTTGIAGTVVTALCCATPLLAVALGALGLGAWLWWADYAVFSALVVFVGMTAYAVVRRQRRGRALRDQDG